MRRQTSASRTFMLKWTPGQMTHGRKEGTPPNHCHTGAHHTPEVGCWAAPLLDKGDFGRTIGFLGKSRTGMWGPRKEVQDQTGSGWLENLQVERGELEIHPETNETNSEV